MGSKKIICAVTNDLVNDRRMFRICTAMHEEGYDVTLLGRLKTDSLSIPKAKFKTVRLRVDKQSGPLFYYQYNRILQKYIEDEKPDLVYAVDSDTLLGCGKAVSHLGCKFVFDSHEYFTEVPELEGAWMKKKIWRFIEKKYIPKADACITVGEELSKIFLKVFGREFSVVRNVPAIRSFDERLNKQEPRLLLYQGVLNKGRGIKEAIDALEFIPDEQIELHLVGGGDLSEELKSYASSKTYKARIVFHGWQTGEILDSFARKAWLGLNLLETKSLNYKYSLANKFFDYMHAGLPSVNMKLPEYENIVSKYPVGLMVEKLKPKDIANAINDISSTGYTKMVSATIQAKKIYNWEIDKKVLIDILDQLI